MMRARFHAIVLLAMALASGPAQAADAAWIRGLHGKPTVTRGEVLLAAGLLTDNAQWKPDAGWAQSAARARGLVRAGEAGELATTATRGFGCRVFARALKIRGGVLMRLTHQDGRYAYRELVLHGFIPDGPSHLPLSGDELVGLLNGAAKYQEKGAARPPGM